LFAVPLVAEKGLPAEAIAETARGLGIPADAAPSVAEAFGAVAALDLDPPPRILITGSLYLAGEVLAANGTPPS
jgi:dihydrofolate synthase / folylpolyglutamate synthase